MAATAIHNRVIYNGVDLQVYTPNGSEQPPGDRWRLLMVEGSLMGGYEQGLQVGVQLLERLATDHRAALGKPVELMVVGRVPEALQRRWEAYLGQRAPQARLTLGRICRIAQAIPPIDRSAHLLYSADVNPACPNSVIEALACGLPVLAFDTGALPELVPTSRAGCIVPYGGDPWRLDPPDMPLWRGARWRFSTQARAMRQAAAPRTPKQPLAWMPWSRLTWTSGRRLR